MLGESRRFLALVAFAWAILAPAANAAVRFAEVSTAWGLDFRHHHGGSGSRYMVETMVGGLVVFDYDGDGDEDVFFVDGAPLPGYEGEAPRSRLYRNEGGGRFVDVTDASGIDVDGYGCGGVAADPDGDGDLDLYVTAFGVNRLFENRGDGTFFESAAAAGVADPMWSGSAAFADVDRDGDLDLYVANYTDFSIETHRFCGNERTGLQGYCHPGEYEGVPDRFYRNRGDGTFAEETEAAGLTAESEAGLGVIFGDLDEDGWPDLYVANDADPNFLFRNRGDGTFEDLSLLSGTAYSTEGSPEAGMGVDLGDVDGDGLFDIVVTNFELETNALYKNSGSGLFIDTRFSSSLAEPSLIYLAFGVAFGDFDHDGDPDLVIANGHILDNAVEFNEASRYGQENQLMENIGGGRFQLAADSGFELERVSRGLAAADLDRDGDLDLVVNNSNQLAEVYENLAGSASGGWLQLDLAGAGANRFGIGTRAVLTAGESRQIREVRTASSYLSSAPPTLHWGLGEATDGLVLELRWPRGKRQRFTGWSGGRRVLVFEGARQQVRSGPPSTSSAVTPPSSPRP